MADWFKTGAQGREHSKVVDLETQNRQAKNKLGAYRFYLKNNESAKIIVLDIGEAPVFFFNEHSMFNILGKGHDPETCIKDSADGPCPLCDSDNPSYCLALTVIDTRTALSKDGTKEYKFQKRVLVAKGRARERWLKRAEARGNNLRGAIFDVSRGSGQTESNVGEDIVDSTKSVTEAQLQQLYTKHFPEGKDFAVWSKPLGNEGYSEFFKPKTAQMLREMIGAAPPIGSSDDLAQGNGSAPSPADISGTGLDGLV